MKKHLLLLLISSSILFSCTSPNKNIISGDIKGLEKGDKVFLAVGSIADTPVVVDSVVVNADGSFYMETSASDTDARLYIMKKGDKLNLRGERVNFFMEGFSTMNIEGVIGDLYYAKCIGGLYAMPEMQERNIAGYISESLIKEYNKRSGIYFTEKGNSNSNKDTLKKLEKEYRKALNVLFENQEKRRVLDSCFREDNPDIAYSASILRDDDYSIDMGIEYYEALYNKLTPRVKATLEGKSLGVYVATLKATSVGSMAPDFKMKDISGNDISLSDFKGKYVFLEFWRTNCGACIMLMPELVEMYEKVKGDDFEVISIALREESEEYLLKVIDELGMVWNNINDTKEDIGDLYGIIYYPSSFFIDPTGKIIGAGHPYDVISKVESVILGE